MTAFALVVASLHAALALQRHMRGGLAEGVLMAFLFYSGVVGLVMFGLASADAVTARAVAVATSVISLATLAITTRGRVRRLLEPWRWLGLVLWSRARQERLLFWASLLVLAVLFTYSAIQAWLLPSDSWDGIWYHDLITASVIESGGTRPVALPMNLIQQANGFPKLAELTSAWWCLTMGREASEFSNLLAVPAFGAGSYLLARRFSPRDVAMAVTSVVLFVPGSLLQWRTTYVDILVAAFGVAALHYASLSRRTPLADLLVAVSMGLAVLTKWNVLTLIPGVVVVWLIVSSPRRTWGDWATTLAVMVVPAIAFAATALPNLRNFDNPLWPVGVSVPRLGVAWPGVRSSAQMNFNASWEDTAAAMLLPAAPGRDFADIRKGGYGLVVPWALVPLAVLSVVVMFARARRRSSSDRRAILVKRAPLLRACAILLPVLPFVATCPAIWSARYLLIGVAAIGSVSMAAARAGGPLRRRIVSAFLWLALVHSAHRAWTFNPALGGASARETWRALWRSPAERVSAAPASWTISPELAVLREKELTRGSVVIFGEEVTFPAVLYNEHFDNRVVYVDGTGPFEDAVERLQPTWIVASDDEPLGRWVRAHAELWEPIGLASRGQPTTAYRRRGR